MLFCPTRRWCLCCHAPALCCVCVCVWLSACVCVCPQAPQLCTGAVSTPTDTQWWRCSSPRTWPSKPSTSKDKRVSRHSFSALLSCALLCSDLLCSALRSPPLLVRVTRLGPLLPRFLHTAAVLPIWTTPVCSSLLFFFHLTCHSALAFLLWAAGFLDQPTARRGCRRLQRGHR